MTTANVYTGRNVKEGERCRAAACHGSTCGFREAAAKGSTAFTTDCGGFVSQGFLYAPFGEIIDEYTGIVTLSALPKYAFNAKELDEETGMYYYEARYYAPPVFTSRDPLFEQKPWLSPYHYCSNNPANKVDPTGMLDDDYFNKDGKYLGSDDAQTDNVRIISQSDWDANKTVDANGNATIAHVVGNEHSQRFSDASSEMTDAAQLAVYEHYNNTNLQIIPEQGTTSGMVTHNKSDGTATIGIYLKANAMGLKICNHANEIINTFVHERNHYEKCKPDWLNYFFMPENVREYWAIEAQRADPSWKKVREKYRDAIIRYGFECGAYEKCLIE